MAIRLAERGVGEVVTLLKADLGTELALIDTDRSGDSLVLAVPASADYYDYPNPVIGDGAAHVEVFESAYDFENPYSDASSGRISYSLPVTVRLTFLNRDGDSRAEMGQRARRYASGIAIVFIRKPTLGGADDKILITGARVVEPDWTTEGEDARDIAKGRVTVELELRCSEVL